MSPAISRRCRFRRVPGRVTPTPMIRAALEAVGRIWRGYWFRAGGRYAAAALRIAIGASVLWMLWRLRNGVASDPAAAPGELYHPIGILKLFPGRPGAGVFAIVWPLAWLSTIAMIAGAWS